MGGILNWTSHSLDDCWSTHILCDVLVFVPMAKAQTLYFPQYRRHSICIFDRCQCRPIHFERPRLMFHLRRVRVHTRTLGVYCIYYSSPSFEDAEDYAARTVGRSSYTCHTS